MKSILIISDGVFHPSILGVEKIQKVLQKSASLRVTRVRMLKAIKNMELSNYDCILLYFHTKQNKKNVQAVEKLLHYSQNGGAILALHGATASFKDNTAYGDMIGGKFTGHDKPSLIRVTGFLNFNLIDELYEHDLSDDCQPLLFGNGKTIYWRRMNKKGKVACFTLGHKSNGYHRIEIMAIIKHAIKYLVESDIS